jgi:hypothetical protein
MHGLNGAANLFDPRWKATIREPDHGPEILRTIALTTIIIFTR